MNESNISIICLKKNEGDSYLEHIFNVFYINEDNEVNKILNNINSKYIIFCESLLNINSELLRNLSLKNKDIYFFKDNINIISNKVKIKSIPNKFIDILILNFTGMIIKKEILKGVDLSINDITKVGSIRKRIDINKLNIELIDDMLFYTSKISSVRLDFIELLNKDGNRYNYLFILSVLLDLYEVSKDVDKDTIEESISKLNKYLDNVSSKDFVDFISSILDGEDFAKISILFDMIKDNDKKQVCYYLKKYSELLELTNMNNEINKEKDLYKDLINKKDIKILKLYNTMISFTRKVQVFIEYMFTKVFLGWQDIWLIGERADQAEDNAYHLFKYIRNNNPKKKIYYIIDKKSVQREKVDKIGNVIYKGSRKHRIYLMHAKKIISAYDFFNFLLPNDSKRFKKYNLKYMNATRIFLQHGVALNKANYYNRYINKYNYFLVSTNKEYNMLTKEYGYKDENIIKIGLARYDNLVDTSKNNKNKKILFMPTWRSDLVDLSIKDFKKSEYFISINNLVNDPNIIKYLNINNIELVVYLHYQMQIYSDCFDSKSSRVKFMKRDEVVVQDLLKECNLLITDYSSVGVDFSYLDKPVIFYQFSKYNFHYEINTEEDYTLYRDFGKIVNTKDEVIDCLKLWAQNDFENFYKIDENLFYNRGQLNNCEKIYDFIENINPGMEKNHIIGIDNKNGYYEKRTYDKNYEFIKREYYKNKIKVSELIYKNGTLSKKIVYCDKNMPVKEVKFYNGIKFDIKYIDVKDSHGRYIIKHFTDKKGELKKKEVYYSKSKTKKVVSEYNVKNGLLKSISKYYEDSSLKSYLVYDENGKAKKFYYYDKNGNKLKEYNYFVSGKVKEKKFFKAGEEKPFKIQLLSELDQSIIKEIRNTENATSTKRKDDYVLCKI